MNLRFANSALQRVCNRRAEMLQRWGADQAAIVAERLHELDAIERLGDLALLPYLRLVADDHDQVVVEDHSGIRIRLALEEQRHSSGGRVSWKHATSVVIVEVTLTNQRGDQ